MAHSSPSASELHALSAAPRPRLCLRVPPRPPCAPCPLISHVPDSSPCLLSLCRYRRRPRLPPPPPSHALCHGSPRQAVRGHVGMGAHYAVLARFIRHRHRRRRRRDAEGARGDRAEGCIQAHHADATRHVHERLPAPAVRRKVADVRPRHPLRPPRHRRPSLHLLDLADVLPQGGPHTASQLPHPQPGAPSAGRSHAHHGGRRIHLIRSTRAWNGASLRWRR